MLAWHGSPARLFLGVWLAAGLACNEQRYSDGPAQASTDTPADCSRAADAPTAFADVIFCCDATRTVVAPGDARALALGAERYVDWIEGGYDGPLEWRRSWDSGQTRGFEPATRLSLQASVHEIDLVHQEPSLHPSNPLLCPNVPCDDYLDFGIHVDVATDDGALRGAADVSGGSGSRPDLVTGRGDLRTAAFTGTLDLGVDSTPALGCGVMINLQFAQTGVQGSIAPWIRKTPGPEGSTSYAIPLVGQWPVPTCNGLDLPIDVDTPLESASGSTPRALFAGVAPQVEATSKAPARWFDGTMTEVSIEVAGDIEHACQRLPTQAYVVVPLHLWTADGRLEQTFPAEVLLSWDDIDATPSWSWKLQTEVLDEPSRESIAGPIASANAATREEGIIEASGSAELGSWSINGKSGSPLAGQQLRW